MVVADVASIDVGFHCTACGKCCNSPPLMTIDELFRHADRFIGALSLRRLRAPKAGTRYDVAGQPVDVSADDVASFAALARRQGHPLPDGDVLVIATQAIDYPSRQRCPALRDDGHCAIHATRPSTCAMVPLDAWVPDRLQPVALSAKRAGGAHYIGADCLSIGAVGLSRASASEGAAPPLVSQGRIVDRDFAAALARRRDDASHEKARWGDAVFGLLAPELLGPARGIAAIPFDGYRTLSLVPVLAVLADGGPAARAQCVAYIDAQRARIADAVAQALARRQAIDKPMTAQLRGFDAALGALAGKLGASR